MKKYINPLLKLNFVFVVKEQLTHSMRLHFLIFPNTRIKNGFIKRNKGQKSWPRKLSRYTMKSGKLEATNRAMARKISEGEACEILPI